MSHDVMRAIGPAYTSTNHPLGCPAQTLYRTYALTNSMRRPLHSLSRYQARSETPVLFTGIGKPARGSRLCQLSTHCGHSSPARYEQRCGRKNLHLTNHTVARWLRLSYYPWLDHGGGFLCPVVDGLRTASRRHSCRRMARPADASPNRRLAIRRSCAEGC